MSNKYIPNILRHIPTVFGIAGVNEIIVFHPEQSCLKVTIFSVKNRYFVPDYSKCDNFVVKASIQLHNEESNSLQQKIIAFLKDNDAINLFAIIIIDDYKYHLLSLPMDEDDDELWLTENYSRFLPPTLALDDFMFTFEVLSNNEDTRTVELIIVRRDFLQAKLKLIEDCGIKLLAVLPSTYFFDSVFKNTDATTVLLVDILVNRIQYLFRDENKVVRNEFHLEHENESPARLTELRGRFNDIRQSLFGSSNDPLPADISMTVLSDKQECKSIFDLLKTEFLLKDNSNIIVQDLTGHSDSRLILSTMDFLLQSSEKVNLYRSEKQLSNRESLEKLFGLRFFLGGGFILFLFLLINNISFISFGNLNEAASDKAAENSELTHMLEVLKKENYYLEKEMTSLRNLQHHSEDISSMMRLLSETIGSGCVLTSLNVHHEKERSYLIRLRGAGISQDAVARFLGNLELSRHVRQCKLLNTNQLDEAALQKIMEQFPETDMPEHLFEFNMTFNYDPSAK